MGTYLGDRLISGIPDIKTINNTSILGSGNIIIPGVNNLFDIKWTDHALNDQSWLQANGSWVDGTTYSNAYNHLVTDISGITSETETIAGYTVTFYRATDGHKICLAAQETTVSNIYTATGIAWYYVLDTTNTRFKLPRSEWGFVGYRDGAGDYVAPGLPDIQGVVGALIGTNTSSGVGLKSGAFSDTTFTGTDNWRGTGSAFTRNNIHFKASKYNTIYGGSSTVQQPATQMYLYFYVGEFSQTATEQTAGLNSELFNGKADTDLGNLSASGEAHFQAPLVSGTNIKTINSTSLLGSGDISITGLPSQTSQSGKFLTTNGTTASWANVPTEIPTQTGNSGKFLTTNGSATSWATITIPTVDQTYNASSTNAQSGVAIAGAGFLKNTATGTNSLTLLGTATSENRTINIGYNTSANGTGDVVIGNNVNVAGNYSVLVGAVGPRSAPILQLSNHAVTIGSDASVNADYGIAVGSDAEVSASSSIQLGYGTNATAKSLSVGFYDSSTPTNYSLLDGATGLIPYQRINSLTETRNNNALKFWTGTKAQYDAISTKDSNTLYNITDDTDVTLTLLNTIYPVGAIYIGTMATCPLATLGVGTWQLVATDRVLQGAGTRGSVGSTVNESLPNITGNPGLAQAAGSPSGAFYSGSSLYTSAYSASSNFTTVAFDASRSSSTYQDNAPVQQDAYLVNIWERVA